MAVERPPSAIRFLFRIEMQHYSCNLAPVSTFRIPVEQAQICDDVLLRAPRRRESIRNQRARYRRHRDQAAVSAYASSRQVVVDQFCAGRVGILMTRTRRSPLCFNEWTKSGRTRTQIPPALRRLAFIVPA